MSDGCHMCPDCGQLTDKQIIEDLDDKLINPCPICGATLKDNETGECVFCRTP